MRRVKVNVTAFDNDGRDLRRSHCSVCGHAVRSGARPPCGNPRHPAALVQVVHHVAEAARLEHPARFAARLGEVAIAGLGGRRGPQILRRVVVFDDLCRVGNLSSNARRIGSALWPTHTPTSCSPQLAAAKYGRRRSNGDSRPGVFAAL